MCIRDRDIREAHRKDKTTADPQPTLDDVKEKFEQAIGPVSYTHLDVYKRQAFSFYEQGHDTIIVPCPCP